MRRGSLLVAAFVIAASGVGLADDVPVPEMKRIPDTATSVAQRSGAVPSGRPVGPTTSDGAADAADLAQQLSNPVASLISVPFQLNYDFGIGPRDAGRATLNVQPVIPFRINESWNLISRTIVPLIYSESPARGISNAAGVGDTVQSLFFSPNAPVRGWIVGAGPVALLPTATNEQFRSKQFGLGPTAVLLRQDKGWTYGALANHIWGVNNATNRDQVNATFLQPFLSYTTPDAWTFSINSESTYNWNENRWTIPINVGISKLVHFGEQPVSFQVRGRGYVDRPSGGPNWGLTFNTTFLFPRR